MPEFGLFLELRGVEFRHHLADLVVRLFIGGRWQLALYPDLCSLVFIPPAQVAEVGVFLVLV